MAVIQREEKERKTFIKGQNTKGPSDSCSKVWQCGTRKSSKLQCKKVYDGAVEKKNKQDYTNTKRMHQRVLPGK